MKWFSPITRISFGLVAVTISLLLVSSLLGFMPDKSDAKLKSRQVISEALAIQFSTASSRENFNFMRETLFRIVQRNDEILSAALRLEDGTLVVKTNSHEKLWGDSNHGHSTPTHIHSTPTHIRVPIFDSRSRWGTMEIRFDSLWSGGYIGRFKNSAIGLIVFMLISGFIMYFFFLKKILHELNPSSVVPDRVKSAFNTLSEGVLILDEKYRVVLVNKAFMDKVGIDEISLVGKDREYLVDLLSLNENDECRSNWVKAFKGLTMSKDLSVSFSNHKTSERYSMIVNSSLIFDANNDSRGVLVTFNDFTELESKHLELLGALEKLEKSQENISKKNEELHRLATLDPLTECLNRRAFFDKFDGLFKYAVEENLQLSCLMLDIDHFKVINDTFGHAVGDLAIKEFANVIRANTRNDDLIGRYGGEEFCVVLPTLEFEKANLAAERLREAVENIEIESEEGPVKFTTSIGLSMLKDDVDSPSMLVSQADQALYSAKKNGRNRCISWEDSNKSGIFDSSFNDKLATGVNNLLNTVFISTKDLPTNLA